ncbi:DNA topoisomerase family protein [Cryptosporidium andersoni]|uniref:DNA topoisomerase n=1 Tax=Cryptosporidium andersoni TaxID=117008 RepID=A0A1J4MV39_9CRYT|nr:DNA topoisomerase family protein [Cryptosporidium andersoni]
METLGMRGYYASSHAKNANKIRGSRNRSVEGCHNNQLYENRQEQQSLSADEYISRDKHIVLCIAEKHSVAKEIAWCLCPQNQNPNYLNSKSKTNPVLSFPYYFEGSKCNMIVTSVRGHIKQLKFDPRFSSWETVDPIVLLNLSTPLIKVISEDCNDIAQNLKHYSKLASTLILWLDCDREGENIAFEVISVCLDANPKLKILRARFSALTKSDIEGAMNNLVTPNRAMSDAVEARQEIDLRIGSSFTRFLTLRYQKLFPIPESTLSYGPCQFPTLGFVVDRYRKIVSFKSEPFWQISVTLSFHSEDENLKDKLIKFDWIRDRIFDHLAALVIYEFCLEDPIATVVSVQGKQVRNYKPLPLNTVEMTKIASIKLNIPPIITMNIAENLYQKGYISYPRTETNSFPESMDLKMIIREQINHQTWGRYASLLISNDKYCNPRCGNSSDESHPPIHPVKCLDQSEATSAEEWKLYELITRHFLAVCSNDAIGQESVVILDIAGEQFKAKGLVVLEENWLDIYKPYERWCGNVLPEFNQGDKLTPYSIFLSQSKTEPPHLITEAELIDLMDKNGIGTDATMHEHIEKIQTRQYVIKNPRSQLIPTSLGYALALGFEEISKEANKTEQRDGLLLASDSSRNSICKFDKNLIRPNLRSAMEFSMKEISGGILNRSTVVAEILDSMKYIYQTMVHSIKFLDNSFKLYFPRWDSDLVFKNGTIRIKNFSICGGCGLYMDLIEVLKNNVSLPALPINNESIKADIISLSRSFLMLVCNQKNSNLCNLPLQLPNNKGLQPIDFRCPYCKYQVIKLENTLTKKKHFICPFCFNNPPQEYSCVELRCFMCSHPTCSLNKSW